ncbi:LysR substrate-binding domain-containing protein [Pleomorphomonas sp. NRK KF1]|uniref:LysR substrate-binding domain-containing protein n=1 Tax=Pleomorphomonas sp. NRK KF1 TaxID=2943000 RepID=UPI002043828B|nr:LysR substrate-binding domain-containing protein [Pleomorphomonas sp. NRK KF1]MCM5552889.1 LysR substrate-binding domain-containing protein [Pleomorphomonas sp. NRK KF1]
MQSYPNIRHLTFLIALAEQRHFRKASEACNASQSTLSAGIAELESLLGVRLAERTRRSVMLTPDGLRIVEQARRILNETEQLLGLGKMASNPLAGRIELGCIPSVGPFLLPRFLPFARQHLPDLVFGLREDKTPALIERLADGRLDLVLMAFPYDIGPFETEMLFDDPFRFVCPLDHPLAALTEVEAARLPVEEMMFMERENCLHRHALPVFAAWPNISDTAYSATSLHMLAAMVAEGLGSTLLPELAVFGGLLADHRVAAIPLADGANSRTIGLVWRRQSPRAAGYRMIAQLIRRWIVDRRQQDSQSPLPSTPARTDAAHPIAG